MRSIDHSNLAKLDSVYETKNSFYLVFELFTGGNLNDYIKEKGVFNENQAAFVLKSVLEGVKYLHNKNIMHRDITPDNIFFHGSNLFQTEQIALAHFGLASFNNIPQYLFLKCGTLGYIAPEIYAVNSPKDHYSLKCDLFSVGVTLYFMLTRGLPYCQDRDLFEQNRECEIDFYRNGSYKTLSKQGFFLKKRR